jgi:sterol desaturase/sphingolipid hydroxylase (fatty acid hydroxylase superfamily)
MATKNYVSNEDKSARLIISDFLEMFTHMHWSTPLIVFVPVVTYFLYRAVSVYALRIPAIVALFLLGVFVWTFTEYVLHRFVFHYQPTSDIGKRLHFLMHGVHHDYPNDSLRLVMAPVISIPLATIFYVVFLTALGPASAAPFFAGFIFGYICYDMIHYATHHAPMKSPYAQWVKHHHMKHHYQTNELGYGVSSPLWDYVFRTTFPEKKGAVQS